MFETKSGMFETKLDRYDAPRAPLERLADRRGLPWALTQA